MEARLKRWQHTVHEIIFEADTPGGKAFDVLLFVVIILSIVAVMLESMAEIRQTYGWYLRVAEWSFTILFTVEYVLRLLSVGRPRRYAFSFFGIVDFLAIVPTYLSFFVAGTQSLIVIRALRLLRVFRVLKLAHFVGEAKMLRAALRASTRKIIVFLGTVVMLVLIIGSLMYLIEGQERGFTSIPQSIYWAVVTMTTVGYGDVIPHTPLGQFLASIVMIFGYGIIAVPTGIVTVEIASAARGKISTQACPQCGREGHDGDAAFCKYCAGKL